LLNTTGLANTANGAFALLHNDTGNSNTANSFSALQSNITGGFNTATGSLALTSNTTGSDNTATQPPALMRLQITPAAASTQPLVKPIEAASEALYRLKPVSYRYEKEIDSSQSPAFGLIAEDVAEVNPAFVACNSEGQAGERSLRNGQRDVAQ
jgi:Chaperone of endosialidase